MRKNEKEEFWWEFIQDLLLAVLSHLLLDLLDSLF